MKFLVAVAYPYPCCQKMEAPQVNFVSISNCNKLITVATLLQIRAMASGTQKTKSYLTFKYNCSAVSHPILTEFVGFRQIFKRTLPTAFLVAFYATLHPAMSVRQLVGRLVPFWAAAPKGWMTSAFTHMENFPFSFSVPPTQILVLRPKSQPQGPNPSLKAQILAWRPIFQS